MIKRWDVHIGQNMMSILRTHNQDGVVIWVKYGVDNLILQTHNPKMSTSYEQNMMLIFQTHNQDGIFIWAKHGVDTTNP